MAPIINPLDELQGFGESKPTYNSQNLRLETARIQSENNAFDMLRRAQAAQRGDMTPSQGWASALLAAIPTLGGYLIGKSVGAPKIPEGTYFKDMGFDDFSKINSASGGASGGLAGLAVGQQNQKDYAQSILEDPKILAAQAQNEMYKSKDLLNDQNALLQAQFGNEAADKRMDSEFEQRKELERLKGEEDRKTAAARGAPEGDQPIDLSTPEKQAAFDAIVAGKGTAAHFSLLSPKAIAAANAAQRERSRAGKVVPGTLDISDKAKLELAEKAAFISQVEDVASEIAGFPSLASYQTTKIASGLDPTQIQSRVNATVATLTKILSGAAATDNERDNIKKFLAGDVTADPATVSLSMRRYAEDQRAMGLRTVQNIPKLKTVAGGVSLFGGSQPDANPSGDMPVRSQYANPQDYLAALRKYNGG
jgi:hypothetical protein